MNQAESVSLPFVLHTPQNSSEIHMATSTVVRDIDQELFFDSIGLRNAYWEAVNKCPMPDNPNVWYLYMPKEAAECRRLVEGYARANLPLFNRYENDGWDEVITYNDRDPRYGSYVVSFPRNVEANEQNADLSGSQIVTNFPQRCITFPEYVVLDLSYWYATRKHLDSYASTLCAGSVIEIREGSKLMGILYPHGRFLSKNPNPKNYLSSLDQLTAGTSLGGRFLVDCKKIA